MVENCPSTFQFLHARFVDETRIKRGLCVFANNIQNEATCTHAPQPSARCRHHASLQRGVHELRELVRAFEACSQKALESLIKEAAVKG